MQIGEWAGPIAGWAVISAIGVNGTAQPAIASHPAIARSIAVWAVLLNGSEQIYAIPKHMYVCGW